MPGKKERGSPSSFYQKFEKPMRNQSGAFGEHGKDEGGRSRRTPKLQKGGYQFLPEPGVLTVQTKSGKKVKEHRAGGVQFTRDRPVEKKS